MSHAESLLAIIERAQREKREYEERERLLAGMPHRRLADALATADATIRISASLLALSSAVVQHPPRSRKRPFDLDGNL